MNSSTHDYALGPDEMDVADPIRFASNLLLAYDADKRMILAELLRLQERGLDLSALLATGVPAERLRHFRELVFWLGELSHAEADLVRLWSEYDTVRLDDGTEVAEGVVSSVVSDVANEQLPVFTLVEGVEFEEGAS